MKKIIAIYLLAIFSVSLLIGCESKREKEELETKKKMERLFGNPEKQLEEWKKSQSKPTKPWWDR